MGSKRFKPKRFEAKRFEAKKIQFKKQDTAAIDKSYLETLERNKIWGENISKFFAPIKKILSPITKPLTDKLSWSEFSTEILSPKSEKTTKLSKL